MKNYLCVFNKFIKMLKNIFKFLRYIKLLKKVIELPEFDGVYKLKYFQSIFFKIRQLQSTKQRLQ